MNKCDNEKRSGGSVQHKEIIAIQRKGIFNYYLSWLNKENMIFRIDFGYQYLYSRADYHPQYLWDGCLECINGEILETYRLEYPENSGFGPGHSPKEYKLDNPFWQLQTQKGMSGIKVCANAGEDTVFSLKTATITLEFRAKDLQEKGRLEFPVGPKYLGCFVTITMEGYYWFRGRKDDGRLYLEAEELGLPVHDWSRMKLAWLQPQETVTWEMDVKETEADVEQLLVQLIAMGVPQYIPDGETQVEARIPMELYLDGVCVREFERFYRFHDGCMQLSEDDWQRIPITPGPHMLGIKNMHSEVCLGINRIVVKTCGFYHKQLSIPEWSIAKEAVFGKVYAAWEDRITVCVPGQDLQVDCIPGWNEFVFQIDRGGNYEVETDCDRKVIEIYEIEEENPPIKVGYDMTVVPHDDNGFMDWLLDYTQRTRLGNYVVFRSFTGVPTDEQLRRWGEYCRKHHIYISGNKDNVFENGVLAKAGGEWFHDCGKHEYTGMVYVKNPVEPYMSEDMKDASEKFVTYLKEKIDQYHTICDCAAFGDATGGSRYSFLAGADFIRAEMWGANSMPFLAQVRPSAEALGKGRWSVHIAIQHAYSTYHATHLNQYFLSLLQPWMMGAEGIYEEDSLFCMFKEERQTWDDALTKGKRDMTRNFYKFMKTHPRKGKNIRKIGFVEGRYAAPFNGIICLPDKDYQYSVWGAFGCKKKEWEHLQPEKCRQLLDVLMPGASTHPLRQKYDKRRFFFAGTPYGDFDCTPIEADISYLKQYKLLLNLGWNTMITEDYQKLKKYVEQGGILLSGLPQFSTHTRREFLLDMENLALIHEGDLRDICGVKVIGKGELYSGVWNCPNREMITEPELSASPSESMTEDGEAYLAEVELHGAQIVAWDGGSGRPMLVKYTLGKGAVYTFTLWAYPGHEMYQRFCAAWIDKLACQVCREDGVYISQESGEVFWTVWKDEEKIRFMILNTDWTKPGNEKDVSIHYRGKTKQVQVREGTAVIVECCDKNMDEYVYKLE